MNNIRQVFTNTSWRLLAEQKLGLIESIKMVDNERRDLLQGLLHFLDCVQDAAHLDGFPVVFLTEEDEQVQKEGRYDMGCAIERARGE